MIWLTWRLHRTEAAIGGALFAALIAIMYMATKRVDTAYNAAKDSGCFDGVDTSICNDRVNHYFSILLNWDRLSTLLHGVPIVLAALVMIPTLHELERGTHRLAWTQSITRRRWAASRLGFAAGIALAVAIVWAGAATIWSKSILRGDEHTFGQNWFELRPAVLIGYSLFAVALALSAAVLVRRLVPALAILTVGFIGVRIFTTFELRPHYRAPLTETVAAANDTGPYTAYATRWMLDESWLTSTGHRISWESVNQLCQPTNDQVNTDTYYHQCLVDQGLQYYRAFQPLSRVSQFQFIEAGLYLGAAAALFLFAFWCLTRRARGSTWSLRRAQSAGSLVLPATSR